MSNRDGSAQRDANRLLTGHLLENGSLRGYELMLEVRWKAGRMGVARKLSWIAAGYGSALGAAIAAVALNQLRMPADVNSGGMAAFGDMVLLVLAAGVFSLPATWFLLKLCLEKTPRTLLVAELLLAATGPASWVTIVSLSTAKPILAPAQGPVEALGAAIVWGAMPRIILGPIVIVIETMTLALARDRRVRAMLAAAMLLDLVPIGVFALHLVAATRS